MSKSNGIPVLYTKYKVTEFGDVDEKTGQLKVVSKRKLASGVSLHEEEAELLNEQVRGTKILFVLEKAQPLKKRFDANGSVAKPIEEKKKSAAKAEKQPEEKPGK